MELFIPGRGSVRLDQTDFVGQGGEGKVYARGKTAYKIYSDPAKMIPAAKIKELSALTHPNIIRPQEILLDCHNQAVGYTMQRVQDAYPLCQVFTRAFRERKNLSAANVLALVQQFQETIQQVHAQNILIVDLNEMNFLLDRALQNVLFIDVDSYQTPGFPPTAIMDSIRDRHSDVFTRETDWFSFAIVSFQMFIGVHPYRGRHPGLPDMDARMQNNISVLNPQVTLPASCYALDTIPPAYRDWYEAVLDQGLRAAPPTGGRFVPSIRPQIAALPAGIKLKISELARFASDIVQAAPRFGDTTAITTDGLFWRGHNVSVRSDLRLAQTPRFRRLIAAATEGNKLRLWDVADKREIACALQAGAMTVCEDRIVLKNGDGLFELRWLELPAGVQPLLHPLGSVLPHATLLLDGAVAQNLLGAWHVSLYPLPGACYTVRLMELNGMRLLDGKFDGNVLMLLCERGGQYTRWILRFGEGFRDYDIRTVPLTGPAEINFVTLDNGVCLHLNDQEELEVFANRKGASAMRVLNEPALRGARLYKDGTRALFSRGNILYGMTLST